MQSLRFVGDLSGEVSPPVHLGACAVTARAKCVWLTGLSGAGKTTIGRELQALLEARGIEVRLLDGDEVRRDISSDLGFSPADRAENSRRIGRAAHALVRDGTTVIVACISPFQSDREAARRLFSPGLFIEIFVDTPLSVCEMRDCKGLYKKARAGLVTDFTGISSPYEPPENPEFVVTSDGTRSAQVIARELVDA